MRTLYLDCGMGAAGDMLLGALLELCEDREAALRDLQAIGVPQVEYRVERTEKCGISGTHLRVFAHGQEEGQELAHSHHHANSHEHQHEHHHEHSHEHHHHHHHATLADIRGILDGLHVPEYVREQAWAIYQLLAEAESKAHNKPVAEIHFHEVGMLDAVADITGVCLLLSKLGVEQIVVSPVHVGSGQVHCAHGILPVPAPATAYLLQGVPMYSGAVQGELCTPTGAALLRYFATEFGPMPVMRVQRIGYGMGTKDFPAANCLRAMLGDTEETSEEILELSCNVDDMTAEEIGHALGALLDGGALEAFWCSVGMKKNRPGVLLTCLCRPEQRERMVELLFRHTTTLGIREATRRRYCLERRTETVQTALGSVRVKVSAGYGVIRRKPEYEDVAAIAKQRGCSLRQVLDAIP